jgi:hypothetical protein
MLASGTPLPVERQQEDLSSSSTAVAALLGLAENQSMLGPAQGYQCSVPPTLEQLTAYLGQLSRLPTLARCDTSENNDLIRKLQEQQQQQQQQQQLLINNLLKNHELMEQQDRLMKSLADLKRAAGVSKVQLQSQPLASAFVTVPQIDALNNLKMPHRNSASAPFGNLLF